MKTTYSFFFTLLITICFGCSTSDPPTPEPEPNYGTIRAKVENIYREFIPSIPFRSVGGFYKLQGGTDDLRNSIYIRINIPVSIASPGTYTLQDGITASLSGGSGYMVWTKFATEATIMISLMTDQKVKGTFYFSSTDPPNEFEITDGTFDLVRE
jgi:hypothetical protein